MAAKRWANLVWVLVMSLWVAALPALGQETAPPSAEAVAALAGEIQEALQAAGDDPAVATEAATEPVKALRAAVAAVQDAAKFLASAADFRAKEAAAPDTLKEIQAELAKPIEPFAPTVASNATVADLERELAQADADVKAARTELDNVAAEVPRRNDRLKAIPTEIAALTTTIDGLRQQLSVAASPDGDATLTAAQRLRSRAELLSEQSKVAELQAEGASYEKRRDLLPARRDRAARRVAAAEAKLKVWQDLVNAQRQQEAATAAQQAREADLARAKTIPALRDIARNIETLKGELTGTDSAPRRLTAATTDLADTDRKLRDLQTRVRSVRKRVVAGQLDSSQGQYLRRELTRLDDAQALARRLGRYHSQYDRVQLRLIELDELEQDASDVERALADVKDKLGPDATGEELRLATDLVGQQKSLVNLAVDTYTPYADKLDQLILTYSTYIDLTRSIRSFIEERIFWVRSVSGSLIPGPGDYVSDLEWLLDPGPWVEAAANGSTTVFPSLAVESSPGERRGPGTVQLLITGSLVAVLIAVATGVRWMLRRRSSRVLPSSGRVSELTLLGTVWKLALAVMAALPQPAAVWIIGWWLGAAAEPLSDPGSQVAPIAMASALERVAVILFGLSLIREISQAGAVGASHFRWPEIGLAHVRRHLRWFTPFAIACALVVDIFASRGEDRGSAAMGRTAFIVCMIGVAVFYAKVLSPARPLIAEYVKKHRGGIVERGSRLWFPLLLALPLGFALATLAGYAYTALQIQRRCSDTILFVVALLIVNALVLRWLQLARRKLAIEAARVRAAAAAQAEQSEGGAGGTKEPDLGSEIDISSISLQSRKVLQAFVTVLMIVGLFGVWSAVLPALKWFERVQILPHIEYIDPDTVMPTGATAGLAAFSEAAPASGAAPAGGEASAASPAAGSGMTGPGMMGSGGTAQAGEPETGTGRPARVTLADLGLALLLVMLTVSASKNVPGLLEITVLQRLPLDAAGRYAYYTVARYLLIIVGVVAISSTLSISWKSAQWLAAALTFGLAFGLQEIFANFVSGLIILFEQPIRVGDTVTVGGVSGTVGRIRMRATTITDWDNKELVIPNKTFITDQVVNWTLSDPTMRLIVPVGIAYGSDVEKAHATLLRVARECSLVHSKPEPRALFLGFGDNSLNFELRVFIGTIENLMACKHELHMRIDREFREAGIEISFPQRDLHVRSVDETVVAALRGLPDDRRTTGA